MHDRWMILILIAVAASFNQAVGQDTSWCAGLSAPRSDQEQICIEPSAGPATGGTLITVKGMGTAFGEAEHPTFTTWELGCAAAVSWQCNFGCQRAGLGGCQSKVTAATADCNAARVYCSTPVFNVESNFFLVANMNESSTVIFPSTGKSVVAFLFFRVNKLEPISGALGFSFGVELHVENTQVVQGFICQYKLFGEEWDPGMGLNSSTNARGESFYVAPLVPASFIEEEKLRCNPPGAFTFLIKHGYPNAQMWIEVAEAESASGQVSPIFTRDERIFTMYLPPNVSSIDFVAGPYSGGTKFMVSGEGFQPFTGLACALLWCPVGSTSTSDCIQVLAKATYLTSTEVMCETSSYDPLDAECSSQCITGTEQDGYRQIRVGTRTIECCKSTCCSETTRVQVALNGKDWIPSQAQYQAEPYILLENSPDVQFTMYVEPFLRRIDPPVGPMKGSTLVTVFGSSFITGSLNVSQGRTYCQFRVLRDGMPQLQDEQTPATFLDDNTIKCMTPSTEGPVSFNIGLSFNQQNFYTQPLVNFSFFSVERVDPPFGGFVGGTVLLVSGRYLSGMEGLSKPKVCRFSNENLTQSVPAEYVPPGQVSCTAPSHFPVGFVQLSVSLDNISFSEPDISFEYILEAFVNSLVPNAGPLTGGFQIEVSGSNFRNSTLLSCRFKSTVSDVLVTGSQVTFVSPEVVLCIAPPSTISGQVLVYVVNNGQQDSANFTTFTYFDIVDLVPDGGTVAGGTQVVVTLSTEAIQGWCKFGSIVVQGVVLLGNTPTSPAAHDCAPASALLNESVDLLSLGNLPNCSLTPSPFLLCTTELGMAPSQGAEIPFSVSLNNRDFASSVFFDVFTFYPATVLDQLSPASGPLRGGTDVLVTGFNFFTLCRTGRDPSSSRCYSCSDEGPDTFTWTALSSCTNASTLGFSARACGLPCRPGKDDRDAFGADAVVYCMFGTTKVRARFQANNRVRCFAPQTPTPSVPTMSLVRLSFNDQQYSEDVIHFGYYTILDLSPRRGPTFGDTVVSVSGHNLHTGAGNGNQIQCLFWLDIYQLGSYDAENDVVLCPVPEQPAEMRDNLETTIDFAVTLNSGTPDQFTNVRLVFEYYQDSMATSIVPDMGPMNGGFVVKLGIPVPTSPTAPTEMEDLVHVDFPYNYVHSISLFFVDDTLFSDRRTVCFGQVRTYENPRLRIEQTCCENPDTEEVCDGAVARASFENSSWLSVIIPPYVSPAQVLVEIAGNGYTRNISNSATGATSQINPSAQFTRQAWCDDRFLVCAQDEVGAPCSEPLDCGGVTFRYWGITGAFPVSFLVAGNVPVNVLGHNFPHPEDQPSQCFFFANGTSFHESSTTVVDGGCDPCPRFNEDDLCVVRRFCTVLQCDIPTAPNLDAQVVTIELSFGASFPLTSQQTELFYFGAANVSSIDTSAGQETGGTMVLVRGHGFIDSPEVYCQLGGPATFSGTALTAKATFIDANLLSCVIPACNEEAVALHNVSCPACGFCDLPLRVTMNQRDFLPGSATFSYRLVPVPSSLLSFRAPAYTSNNIAVTITGVNFTNVGASNSAGYGLSCRFGATPTSATFDSSCSAQESTCGMINCIPPFNNASGPVEVSVSLDGQQWIALPDDAQEFAYFELSGLQPPFVLETGSGIIAIAGLFLDNGRSYACRFQPLVGGFRSYSIAEYDLDENVVRCEVPPLIAGDFEAAVSLTADTLGVDQRDYTAHQLPISTYVEATVDELQPTRGDSRGGIIVTVLGSNFWDSGLLECKFGDARTAAVTLISTSLLLCSSPPQFGETVLEVSFNQQQFSTGGVVFVNYKLPEVAELFPAHIPVGVSWNMVVFGAYFENFDTTTCIFQRPPLDGVFNTIAQEPILVPARFVNDTAVECQVPPSDGTLLSGTYVDVYVTNDGLEQSESYERLVYFTIENIAPFVGPSRGGTSVVFELSEASRLPRSLTPTCRFVTEPGLDVQDSETDIIYAADVTAGGQGYIDGIYPLIVESCKDGEQIVFGIDIDNLAQGYADGIFNFIISCEPPCTGSGLVATYEVSGLVIIRTAIVRVGSGYNETHPPSVQVNGCDGIGGTGSCEQVSFTIRIGANCRYPGCCASEVVGEYAVFNGSLASAQILKGGRDFNFRSPPVLAPNGCDGAGAEGNCKSCALGIYIPTGSCAEFCNCSGQTAFCSDGSDAGSCGCIVPNTNAPCLVDTNCTGGGICRHSGRLAARVANVSEAPGIFDAARNITTCVIPKVSYPSSVNEFEPMQSFLAKNYPNMPALFIKIQLFPDYDFTLGSGIFRFHEFSNITSIHPNSASGRGGSTVTVYGNNFRRESNIPTVLTNNEGGENKAQTMQLKCRLHELLPSQPTIWLSASQLLCSSNRVCFEGSTMPGCRDCIIEGCPEPVQDYSVSLPTDIAFSVQISLNDQAFVTNLEIPFYVYSITSFRPFGGLYNGGTHVTISGIGFDRGGAGPYDAMCKFSRIRVPAQYDPELRLLKCISQPLLDIDTILEIHLGANQSDYSLYTDDRQIFYYYTAYPYELSISPDSGSFTGLQPITFSVPEPEQFNWFWFRSYDFNTILEGVQAVLQVTGEKNDSPNLEAITKTVGRRLIDAIAESDPKIFAVFSDVTMGERIWFSPEGFTVDVRIEPAEFSNRVKDAFLEVVGTDGNQELRQKLIDSGLGYLNVSIVRLPAAFSLYSEFGAFARFGSVTTVGKILDDTTLEGIIAASAVDGPSTVEVSFCMNGQQFSELNVEFYYYTVDWVLPFGVPIQYQQDSGDVQNKLKWWSCPYQSLCGQTQSGSKPFRANIRVYGSNFRRELGTVDGIEVNFPRCRWGRLEDSGPGIIGFQLSETIETNGVINWDEGYVDCQQPQLISLQSFYDESNIERRIRVEVALNGRDFSFSDLQRQGPSGLVLYEEPRILSYFPEVGPLAGNTTITITGEKFRTEGTTWRVPTSFCVFAASAANFAEYLKVPATVISDTVALCNSPNLEDQGFGYASGNTDLYPPENIKIFLTFNDYHLHSAPGPVFSFFAVRFLNPRLSANEFDVFHSREVTVGVSTGFQADNEGKNMFCWWRIPGSAVTSGFVVQGTPGFGNADYTCNAPDWTIETIAGSPATDILPCQRSIELLEPDSGAVCNNDGSLTVRFGVAFSSSLDRSLLTLNDFSFSETYTYYAAFRFRDFLPKMGNELGGTGVHIYGANFIDWSTLQCKFGDGQNQQPAANLVFRSSELIICETPPKALSTVLTVYVSMNGVHWSACDTDPACTLEHPYYGGATTTCCLWENSLDRTERQLFSFSYSPMPIMTDVDPESAPTQGDTYLRVVANNLATAATIEGTAFACLIGDEIDNITVPGTYETDGGLPLLACLTRPGLKTGLYQVRVSMNEFEWSEDSRDLRIFEPTRLFRVNPSFTPWDETGQEVTIIGKNFIVPDLADGPYGSIVVRFVEFDSTGLVRWKQDKTVLEYGPNIPQVYAPSLEEGFVTDVITVEAPARSACTQLGALYCEAGVVKVFVSQNDGFEWTWEDVEFTYIREPTENTICFGDVNGNCAVEAFPSTNILGIPDVEFYDIPENIRGTCNIGETDEFGQAATSGFCVCTSGDCAIGAYDCGDQEGQVDLGCSMKAAITHVEPRSGPQAGGTLVYVRGFLIENGNRYWCRFGSQDVRGTFNQTTGLLECVTPPLAKNGSVEVEISISDRAEWTVSHGSHTFHYFFPPTILGLEPSLGPATGGTELKLTAGFTDIVFGLDTLYRSLDLNQYGVPICSGPIVNTLCNGMYQFGSYTDHGPITPHFEELCVASPHCRFQLQEQHRALGCRFEATNGLDFVVFSTDAEFLRRNVVQCTTPRFEELMNTSSEVIGAPFLDMNVSLTLNGDLWHPVPVLFRYHGFNNITSIFPEVGVLDGGTTVTLFGTGFVDSNLAVCKFGAKESTAYNFINETHVSCISPANEVFQKVEIQLSFNGVQFEAAQQLFEYVPDWILTSISPEVGQEIGGVEIVIKGMGFVDAEGLSCKFGDIEVFRPYASFQSEQQVTCILPKTILPRPTFATHLPTCEGEVVEGTPRLDAGWTICAGCTDCCECPQCPECNPQCVCPDIVDESNCCIQDDGSRLLIGCPPDPALPEGEPRHLCLPPEFDCRFISFDETSKKLECDLAPFQGVLLYPDDDEAYITSVVPDGAFLHPDLALRKTVPFYVSMNGQDWFTGCISGPLYGDSDYQEPPCNTYDLEGIKFGEQWRGTFTIIEKYNVTRFKPAVAPAEGNTPITVYGEGFVNRAAMQCKFGFINDGTFDPENPRDLNGDLVGVEPYTVAATFVDSFSLVCVSPPLDRLVYDLGGEQYPRFVEIFLEVSMSGTLEEFSQSEVPFYYSEKWLIYQISPKQAPTRGGTIITVAGPYFHISDQIMCKFGNYFATQVVRVDATTIECRTPSVSIHQAVNVSITVDGTTWSESTNETVMEYMGVRNLLTFGENAFGQLGFGVVEDRWFEGYVCDGGMLGKLSCTTSDDCPGGVCVFVRKNLNWEPTFVDELFARNVTNIAMGQGHTLIVSSETYGDVFGTTPRGGVPYIWGDNLVGQLGFGFAGPSEVSYNFTAPAMLVCGPSVDTDPASYLLDQRTDSREIVGFPSDWPATDWIIPTCIKLWDQLSEGEVVTSEIILHNPFYYKMVTQIATGSFHSLTITNDGDLYSWGWNNQGQLGMGPLETRPNIPYPSQVFYFRQKTDVSIVKVAAGFSHSAAVDENGNLYTWGSNKYGQLGLGDFATRKFPELVEGFVDSRGATYTIVDIQCGLYHCLALTNVGQIWSFGSNSRGQLGTCESALGIDDNLDYTCEEPTQVQDKEAPFSRPFPKKIDFLRVTDYAGSIIGQPLITTIAAGAYHSMAIGKPCITALDAQDEPCPAYDMEVGDLYTWGNNKYGQLGTGRYSDMTYEQLPTLITSLNTVLARCRAFQTEDCIESDDYFRAGKAIMNVGAGAWHSIVTVDQREDTGYRRSPYQVNRIYSMGNNDEGQLGLGDTTLRDTPTEIESNFVRFHDVGAHYYQSLFTQGCPPSDENVCSGNGMCFEQGICDCDDGYRGQDCNIECDGGAESVCSLHGAPQKALEIAAWRQSVIKAAAGHNLRRRMNFAFSEYYCIEADGGLFHLPRFLSESECDALCTPEGAQCELLDAKNITSDRLVDMLDQLANEYPAMSTAVFITKEDWPIHLFNQGLRTWTYSYEARQEILSNLTVGPSHGVWTHNDVVPIVRMLQNRSTCWGSFSCNVEGACTVVRGYTRTTDGESRLDVFAGCRDGWTAQIHFRKRLEEIDQVWSNLEVENKDCDPQSVAYKFGLRKEQVQYIWTALETDPKNISVQLQQHQLEALRTEFSGDRIQTILSVWDAFETGCSNFSLGETSGGCLFDGTCVCEDGYTGSACDITCSGGVDVPCSNNGICTADGTCLCDRGWTGPSCELECSGAADHPAHWPCNLHGHCHGWFADPRTQFHYGPIFFEEAEYVSIGGGISFFSLGTLYAWNGTCLCHYGFRNDWGQTACSIECPGTPLTYLDEYGECFDNGFCNATGVCECFEGYRNVSCNVECLGGHLPEPSIDGDFSNECTALPICDVYPDFEITTLEGTVLCKDMQQLRGTDEYSKDYRVNPAGSYLRVYNGLCQFQDFEPRLSVRFLPVPNCPGEVWCDPELKVAGRGGECTETGNCVEDLTRKYDYFGNAFNSTTDTVDPQLGRPPAGCPSQQCDHLPEYLEEMGYPENDNRFKWHSAQSDVMPHHSTAMGECYCLPGFRGESCSQMCPGGVYAQSNLNGVQRMFPTSLDRQPDETTIYGIDMERGWDTDGDGTLDGVAGRSLDNICSGNGYCEEDASCSCFLTDRGAHTNDTDVSGWRGEACELECAGGAYTICSRQGVCDDIGRCTCFKGYRNATCGIACRGLRDCTPGKGCEGVCNYAGDCDDFGTCTCYKPFRGDACELVCPPGNGIASEVCSGRGSCDENAVCRCNLGYEGTSCERIAWWVITVLVLLILLLLLIIFHIVRRYLHSRLRKKRRARRERRKVRRTQAAVGRLKNYKVSVPDAVALEAKGL